MSDVCDRNSADDGWRLSGNAASHGHVQRSDSLPTNHSPRHRRRQVGPLQHGPQLRAAGRRRQTAAERRRGPRGTRTGRHILDDGRPVPTGVVPLPDRRRLDGGAGAAVDADGDHQPPLRRPAAHALPVPAGSRLVAAGGRRPWRRLPDVVDGERTARRESSVYDVRQRLRFAADDDPTSTLLCLERDRIGRIARIGWIGG